MEYETKPNTCHMFSFVKLRLRPRSEAGPVDHPEFELLR